MPRVLPLRNGGPGGDTADPAPVSLAEFGTFGRLQVDGFGERVSLALEARARALLDKLRRHHPDSAAHSVRVAEITMGMWRMAPELLGSAETALLGSLLHDIGKIFVPRAVLSSQRLLTDREWAIVASHSARGATLLREAGFPEAIAAVAAGHHERWAGGGYPTAEPASNQPRIVRAVAVADAFDAMTDPHRAYRAPLNRKDALQETEACAGTHFEPRAAQLLADSLEGAIRDERWAEAPWPAPPVGRLGAAHLELQLLGPA